MVHLYKTLVNSQRESSLDIVRFPSLGSSIGKLGHSFVGYFSELACQGDFNHEFS